MKFTAVSQLHEMSCVGCAKRAG